MFGSLLLNLPVAVAVWLNEVYTACFWVYKRGQGIHISRFKQLRLLSSVSHAEAHWDKASSEARWHLVKSRSLFLPGLSLRQEIEPLEAVLAEVYIELLAWKEKNFLWGVQLLASLWYIVQFIHIYFNPCLFHTWKHRNQGRLYIKI